jgi:hypothetical protein
MTGRGLCLERIRLALDRRSNCNQQFFASDGLGKKAGCSLPHRFLTIRLGSLRADEYDWHTIVSSGQFFLKFQAGKVPEKVPEGRCQRDSLT